MPTQFRTLKQVMANYNQIEDYIKAYVDNLAERKKKEFQINHYARFHGIFFINEDLTKGTFPSYHHWRFNPNFKFNRELYG